jgi:TadE-like protein
MTLEVQGAYQYYRLPVTRERALSSKALGRLRVRRNPTRTTRSSRGQSLVEFGLVIPILLMLLIAIGDFGRIFATGLLIEAAARNAAEAAANEYLAGPPGPLNAPAPAGDPVYYSALHDKTAKVVCAETQELPNSNFNAGTGKCPGMPFVMVCIHDSQDTDCNGDAFGQAVSAGCNEFTPPPNNAHGGALTPRWAEVRVCYQFTPILNLPIYSFGEFWLQRTRSFTIPCYFALGSDECG